MTGGALLPPALARDLAGLTADPAHAGFGPLLLAAAQHAARLRNLAAFHLADRGRAAPVLTLAEGDLGQYRLRRNARDAAGTAQYRDRFADLARLAPDGRRLGAGFTITTPRPTDPHAAIYARSGLIQRVAAVQRAGRALHVLTLYRSVADGPLGDAEIARLRSLMPVLVGMTALRHRLTAPDLSSPPAGRVARARAAGHPLFARLSEREAEICDLVVSGLGTAGMATALDVSENSVRTFRARAYRKLGITAVAQLFALVLAAEAA